MAVSAPQMDYFLTNIALERGAEIHNLAISALEKHIEYYEKLRNVNLNSMRGILKKHKNQISKPMS
jgi:hypothetical protein